jgi:hypothetical protein
MNKPFAILATSKLQSVGRSSTFKRYSRSKKKFNKKYNILEDICDEFEGITLSSLPQKINHIT